MFPERIKWLEAFFDNGSNDLPNVELQGQQVQILTALGYAYRFTGEPRRALSHFKHCRNLTGISEKFPLLPLCGFSEGMTLREIGSLREAALFYYFVLLLFRAVSDEFENDGLLRGLGRIYSTVGNIEKAQLLLLRADRTYAVQLPCFRNSATSAYIAETLLWQEEHTLACRFADRSWEFARDKCLELDFIRASLLQGKAKSQNENKGEAMELLYQALIRSRKVCAVEYELPALVALAELDLKMDNPTAAKARLDDVWDAAERGPYPLYQADAYNVLTAICRAKGDKAGAIDAATKAYKAAWCDGPPWAYHWGLEKAKAHLHALGASEPDMPPFDESKYEKMPKVEINPKDEYWVDPSVPLKALLDLD